MKRNLKCMFSHPKWPLAALERGIRRRVQIIAPAAGGFEGGYVGLQLAPLPVSAAARAQAQPVLVFSSPLNFAFGVLRKRNSSPRCALACCLSLLGERQLLGTINPGSRHFPESGESPNAPLPTPPDPISHLLHDSDLAMRPLRSRALGVAPGQVHEPGQVPGPRP